MEEDILGAFAEQADDAPSDEDIESVRVLCADLVRRQQRADELEAELKREKREIWELRTKTIPDAASERGIDHVGLSELGVDIRIRPYYKANISADWPEEQKRQAFDYLEQLGVGDIVRTRVEYSLGKDSMETALAMDEIVRSAARQLGVGELPQPSVGMSVPWNTLTSTVKELTNQGVALDLETLGATVGQMAEIKERKE